MVDWDNYSPFFKKSEFDCKHTGKNRMRPEFLDLLKQIRVTYGKPMVISSGYRDVLHPVEAGKGKPGAHTYGVAADIAVSGIDALDLIVIAYGYGIRRIGINQKGSGRYIHLDTADQLLGFPKSIWTY